MKKVLTALLFCLTLLFSFSAVGAEELVGGYYPKYLKGNQNLELAWGHMDVGMYLDKTMVGCLIYNPPYYKLWANLNPYDFKTQEGNRYITKFYEYDISTGAIYISDSKGTYREGPYYAKNENNPSSVLRPLAEAKLVWKTVYNMDWQW